MKIRNVRHDTVVPYLKMSKSAPEDRGPYVLERKRGDYWWTLTDASGAVVAQLDNAQAARVGIG